MDRYAHSTLEGEVAALSRLPDLSVSGDEQILAATGTDGQSVLADCLAESHGLDGNNLDKSRQSRRHNKTMRKRRKSLVHKATTDSEEGYEMERVKGSATTSQTSCLLLRSLSSLTKAASMRPCPAPTRAVRSLRPPLDTTHA